MNKAEFFLFPRYVDRNGQSLVNLQEIAQKTMGCNLPHGIKIISATPASDDCIFPVGMRWSWTPASVPTEININKEDASYGEWVFNFNNNYTYGKTAVHLVHVQA